MEVEPWSITWFAPNTELWTSWNWRTSNLVHYKPIWIENLIFQLRKHLMGKGVYTSCDGLTFQWSYLIYFAHIKFIFLNYWFLINVITKYLNLKDLTILVDEKIFKNPGSIMVVFPLKLARSKMAKQHPVNLIVLMLHCCNRH